MNRGRILKLAALAAAVLAAAGPLTAQTLAPSPKTPSADGTVSPGEYSYTSAQKDMTVHLSLSADGRTLHAALEAPTTGWTAIGLGSLKMDGAFMVLGYDAAGVPAVREDTGKGHRHTPNPTRILTAQAVRETAGKTTLEFALPAAPHAAGSSLKLILAYGRRDDFTSIHARYAQVEVPIAR